MVEGEIRARKDSQVKRKTNTRGERDREVREIRCTFLRVSQEAWGDVSMMAWSRTDMESRTQNSLYLSILIVKSCFPKVRKRTNVASSE
jgi:hypothetical protein